MQSIKSRVDFCSEKKKSCIYNLLKGLFGRPPARHFVILYPPIQFDIAY